MNSQLQCSPYNSRKCQYPAPPAYQPTAPSAPGLSVLSDQDRMTRLGKLAQQYELSGGAVGKLRQLEDYDIVIVADDSSSMKQNAHDIPKDNPLAVMPTRWEELCRRVGDILKFATALDKDGVDIYFLNRGKFNNITHQEQARELFSTPPFGYTPLRETYQRVINDKLSDQESKILILIATDGEPNIYKNGSWKNDTQEFISYLIKRKDPHRCPTSIMACTDDESEISWLNDLDDKAPYIDVLDDYQAEKAEVLAAQKNLIQFKEGDYIVKTLLGPIDEIYDNLDEKMLTPKQRAEYTGEEPPAEVNCFRYMCVIS